MEQYREWMDRNGIVSMRLGCELHMNVLVCKTNYGVTVRLPLGDDDPPPIDLALALIEDELGHLKSLYPALPTTTEGNG